MTLPQPARSMDPHPGRIWDSLVVAIVIVAVSLGLSGCATYGGSNPPDVQQVGQFSVMELGAELRKIPEIGDRAFYDVGLNDSDNVGFYSTYRPRDYVAVQRWLRPKLPEWSEGFLCVQYAQAMRLGMSFAAAKDEWYFDRAERNPPAIGWFVVRQIHDWGGVSGDTDPRHALNIYVAGPRRGMSVWVMEPQNGQHVRVAWQDENAEWVFDPSAYPNWKHIEFVRLEL